MGKGILRPFVVIFPHSLGARVYTGAFATRYRTIPESPKDKDADLAVHTLVTGYPSGQTDVFHTEYSFFAAAAIVELVCILLIAPT